MDDSDYATLCERFFEELEERLDERDDIDYESNGDICEVTLADGSVLVVNRQPPLREIWLATKGGGYHFRHEGGRWLDTRDGAEFFDRLGECLGG